MAGEEYSIPWVEKYRPTNFEEIVMDPVNSDLFQKIIQKEYFPHLLFYGPPGTGKTTTIINLIQEYQKKHSRINKENIIHLNASDERGIDIIRNQIFSFVRSNNLFEKGLKFVILDEVDYMTKNAQHALKYLLQTTHTANVRFCLICNYISKIDSALKNEFTIVRFNQLPEINYLQLNKDSLQVEWNRKICSKDCMISLHEKFRKNESCVSIIRFIHECSIDYNIDKFCIIQKYLNYIVRNHSSLLNKIYFDMIENVVHAVNSPIHETVKYFVNTNLHILHT
jgi:replication factor C subunit 3/5